jgi:hypothetical protein
MAYGGGSEEFSLGAHDNRPKVMFCTAGIASLGAGGMGGAGAPSAASVDLLTCELWIEGAATVWVSGGEYEELEVELRGEANECGPETVEEELVLVKQTTDPDGSSK